MKTSPISLWLTPHMPSPEKPSAPKKKQRRRRRQSAIAQIRAFNKQDWRRAISGLRESLTGIGISVGFHALLLLIMAFIVYQIPNSQFPPIQLGWSTKVEAPEKSPTQSVPVVSIPSVSLTNKENTTAAPAEAKPTMTNPAVDPDAPEPDEQLDVSLADVSQSLALRQKETSEKDGAGAGAVSGTGREAIELALAWIVKQQHAGGYWELTGPYPDAGSIDTKTGGTSLALLALLGDGQTHKSGLYLESVQKGLDWLVKNQKSNGDLFDSLEEGREPHFYAHAQGTIVLCEALALTRDISLLGPAERAVQFLIDSQNPELGGWKYRPLTARGIGDLSVTGWALMALHSARMAEIEVPFQTFVLAERFLNSTQEQPANATYYKYRPDFPTEESQRWSMTAEGLLCRQWLGWPSNYPAMRRGVEFLLAEKNKPVWLPNQRNVYAWYYTSQTLHNLGGKNWENWFSQVLQVITTAQTRAGSQRGSWHPNRPPGAFHERSHDAGRLYLTVMCVLILETPYRHAPLYAVE